MHHKGANVLRLTHPLNVDYQFGTLREAFNLEAERARVGGLVSGTRAVTWNMQVRYDVGAYRLSLRLVWVELGLGLGYGRVRSGPVHGSKR